MTMDSDHVQQVYLDLPPEVLRALPAPLEKLAERRGVALPDGLEITEAALPPGSDGLATKDWGLLIQLATPENLAAATAALSGLILVLSQFLKDRAHGPKLRWEIEELEIEKPDGSVIRRRKKTPILLEPGPQLNAELGARLAKGQGLIVKARVES